jgi:tRNA U34 5-carboxymethylaminomethyl modifying GTPase MnmE/TrmE
VQAGPVDLGVLAEELRVAASELKRLSGNFSPEDILDVVFAEFCVGK